MSTDLDMFTAEQLFVKDVQKELLIVGGFADYAGTVGLFCATCANLSSGLTRSVGARLLELCEQYSVEITGVRYEKDTDECFYLIKCDNKTQEVKIF